MNAKLKAQVRRRAGFQCEYCLFPESLAELRFQFDHIIARQHGGPTEVANLAMACFRCNSHKGPNLSGVDPVSGRVVRLFHPRIDSWAEHFTWKGPLMIGLTPTGRATIELLEINRPDVVLLRTTLLREGVVFAPAH